MRLFLVIQESTFFQPDFLSELLNLTQDTDEVVGAAVITKVPVTCDYQRYIRKNWTKLHFREILLLVCRKYSSLIFNLLHFRRDSSHFFTVRQVLNHWGIEWFSVENNINRLGILDKIERAKPDVIINSGSLILREKLLKLPTKCCINRHSSLLPSFGGLWPVFHAVRLDEPVGVTAHIMAKKFDVGLPLAQKEIDIERQDSLFDLYKKTFDVSAEVIFEALNKVRVDDHSPPVKKYRHSYYSWPTNEDWVQFRSKGMRWI